MQTTSLNTGHRIAINPPQIPIKANIAYRQKSQKKSDQFSIKPIPNAGYYSHYLIKPIEDS